MQNLVRSKTMGVTGSGGRGTAGAGPGRDLLYYQGVAPPGLSYLTHRCRAKQGKEKGKHKQAGRLCLCVYV